MGRQTLGDVAPDAGARSSDENRLLVGRHWCLCNRGRHREQQRQDEADCSILAGAPVAVPEATRAVLMSLGRFGFGAVAIYAVPNARSGCVKGTGNSARTYRSRALFPGSMGVVSSPYALTVASVALGVL